MTCSTEIKQVTFNKSAWHDMSGKQLNGKLVEAARDEEMVEVRKHKVYMKVPVQQCFDEAGQAPIGTRWVDANKGDRIHPEY